MKIMIVEDYAVSLKIMIKKLAPLGECTGVSNGEKALALFDEAVIADKRFDLIFLDISMPDMDGIEVLTRIRKKEKRLKIEKDEQTKIVMVSASMRMASIKKCIRLGCNSYISKPFKTQKIYEEFERLGFPIPEAVKAEEDDSRSYTDLVAQIINRFNSGEIELPVLPHIVKEVQKLLNSDDPSIEDLSKIVQKDAVISSKLILTANSPLYKGQDKVNIINDALVRIGLKEALSLITTITTQNLFKANTEPLQSLLNKLWLHSLACAGCCKLLAEELKEKNIESVFLMGIIHDIGKVLLLQAISDIGEDKLLTDKQLLTAIQEVHTVFGAVLIKKWGFSPNHIRATELHHWESFPEETELELLVVHIANRIVNHMGFESFEKTDDDLVEDPPEQFVAVLEQAGIKPARIKDISDRVADTMVELSDDF